MYNTTRDEEVAMIKKMWKGQTVICPRCKAAELTLLHKKAKKSNNDWICPACGEVFRTISMLYDLPEK